MNTKVEKLILEVNEFAAGIEDYLNDDGCMYADYAVTFGYGEGELDTSHIGAEDVARIRQLKRRFRDNWHVKLAECCESLKTGVCYQDNEIFGVHIGEHEEQFDSELWARITALSDKEYEYLRRHIDCYIQSRADGREPIDCAYFNRDYERWVLMLDSDKLSKLLADAESA